MRRGCVFESGAGRTRMLSGNEHGTTIVICDNKHSVGSLID